MSPILLTHSKGPGPPPTHHVLAASGHQPQQGGTGGVGGGMASDLGRPRMLDSTLSLPCCMISGRSLNFSELNMHLPPIFLIPLIAVLSKVILPAPDTLASWVSFSPFGCDNVTLFRFSSYTVAAPCHPLLSLSPPPSRLKLLGLPALPPLAKYSHTRKSW